MKASIMISGMGGQGVVSIGLLLAECAAKTSSAACLPEHGPEQRGGYSRCTITISDAEIISPSPKKYTYIIAMDEPSYKKFAGQMEVGGLMFLNADLIPPGPADGQKLFIPAESIAAELRNPRAANIVLLGALIGASGLLPKELIMEEIREKFGGKPAALAANLAAFEKGLEMACKQA